MLEVGIVHYLVLAALIFCIGLVGVLVRRNAIVILMSIELMLNAVNLTFVAFGFYNSNVTGFVVVFFVMTVAACEAAVGLALAVAILKRFKEINIRNFELLKG
jgi:NADH-quinone oxidoreductase subunit K